MKYSLYLLVTCLIMLATACNEQTPIGRPVVAEGDVVATVNGVEITRPELDQILEGRMKAGNLAPLDEVLDELIEMEVLRQKAIQFDTHKDPAVAAQMNRHATNVLVRAYVDDVMANHEIDEAEIQKEYEYQLSLRDKFEYNVSQIIVRTEKEGIEIIERLAKGEDFAEIAKYKSIEPSGRTGGRLGWGTPGNYVKEFGEAVAKMEVGKYSDKPLKTKFGWHIIWLEDKRALQQPTLDSLRDSVRRHIMQNQIDDIIAKFREDANIQIADNVTPTSPAK